MQVSTGATRLFPVLKLWCHPKIIATTVLTQTVKRSEEFQSWPNVWEYFSRLWWSFWRIVKMVKNILFVCLHLFVYEVWLKLSWHKVTNCSTFYSSRCLCDNTEEVVSSGQTKHFSLHLLLLLIGLEQRQPHVFLVTMASKTWPDLHASSFVEETVSNSTVFPIACCIYRIILWHYCWSR